MDPITHAVAGAAISKVMGLQLDFTDPLISAVIVGSVFPDIDILLQKWGHYVYLKNHRGITHSIIGILFSAVIITALISLIYKDYYYFKILTGVIIGLLSHISLDLLNTYGAKFLWPFYKKKISVSLSSSFDPILLSLMICFVILRNNSEILVVSLLISYVLLRILMRFFLYNQLEKLIEKGKIRIYPSLTNLFKWHFVLDDRKNIYVGQKNYITGDLCIRRKFKKHDENKMEFVLNSRVGNFLKSLYQYIM